MHCANATHKASIPMGQPLAQNEWLEVKFNAFSPQHRVQGNELGADARGWAVITREELSSERVDQIVLEAAGGGAAVNKRRNEDLACAKIAPQQNQRLAAG